MFICQQNQTSFSRVTRPRGSMNSNSSRMHIFISSSILFLSFYYFLGVFLLCLAFVVFVLMLCYYM